MVKDIADFGGVWKISPAELAKLKETLKRVKNASMQRLLERVRLINSPEDSEREALQ